MHLAEKLGLTLGVQYVTLSHLYWQVRSLIGRTRVELLVGNENGIGKEAKWLNETVIEGENMCLGLKRTAEELLTSS